MLLQQKYVISTVCQSGGFPGFPEIPFSAPEDWEEIAIQSAIILWYWFLSRSTYRIADGCMNYTISLSLFQI